MNKYIVMIVTAIAVVVKALPQNLHVEFTINSVDEDAIIAIIEEGIEKMKESGLDPYINEGEEYGITVNYPLPGNLQIYGYFKNFEFTGLSDIVVNRVSQEKHFLYLELTLPRLEAFMEEATTEVSYENDFHGKIKYSGSLAINEIRFTVQIHPSFLGPTLEDLEIDVSFGSIESNLEIIVGETDVSSFLNNFLEVGLPILLKENAEMISENLSKLVLALIGHRK